MSLDMFNEEMENMFYLNKINMSHGATPQHLLNAAGFTGGWDLEKLFVQKSMRVRPLYCEENGVMMEICVPSIMDRFYGDVEQIIDIGTFNIENKSFSHMNAPTQAINTRKDGKLISFNDETCMNPFELGFVCSAEAMNSCNVATFEDCPLVNVQITTNFTYIRDFSTFYLVATLEKEGHLLNSTGDSKLVTLPANIFLVAVGDGETVVIGEEKMEPIKGTKFSKTTFINVNELAEPKQMETQAKKNFIQKMFSFFGK
ncbi:unnamed protein product, partial [Mesorhabditis belari]|uniref:Uncharacterized protein n=1 Tax=Mesorhabditis belari TaxID=2138241 RepID=A0AAF3FP90_9BILA